MTLKREDLSILLGISHSKKLIFLKETNSFRFSSYLTKEKIKDYNENYEECSKTKNPVLLKAVALANDLKSNLPLCEGTK